MNPNEQPSLDESIKQVMQTLPPVIQSYLTQGKYTLVAEGLMRKYKLRVDQAGVLERELMLLLMGIDNPTEFAQALAEEAALDQQTISAISKDVNDQVFVPLREQERKAEPVAQAPTRATIPVPNYAPPAPTTPVRPPLAHIAPLPPKLVMPGPPRTPSVSGPRSIVVETLRAHDNVNLLSDHEESHIEFSKSPRADTSSTVSAGNASQRGVPLPPAAGSKNILNQSPSVPMSPRSSSTGLPLPHTRPEQGLRTAPARVVPLPPNLPTGNPAQPPVRSYATDPYHEPIE